MHPTITPIGVTNYRNKNLVFGIKDNDFFGHIFILGKTGVGKSTLLKSMIHSMILNDRGVMLIDPHGDLCNSLLTIIPEHRKHDVIYFQPKARRWYHCL